MEWDSCTNRPPQSLHAAVGGPIMQLALQAFCVNR